MVATQLLSSRRGIQENKEFSFVYLIVWRIVEIFLKPDHLQDC